MLAPKIASLEYGKKKAALAQRILNASPPNAKAALHLALSREFQAEDSTLLQCFQDIPLDQRQTLLNEGPRGLARLLLTVSAVEGEDVQVLAEKWVGSEDEDDAKAAVGALAAIGSPTARRLIAKALAHPHYRVRRAAIGALAPKADRDEKVALYDLVTDRSAPVRAALAVVIGQHRWTDGLDALLTLLDDRRNYARHFLHQHRDEPEYHVARAAANAFGQLDSLPVAVLDRISEFLIREDEKAIDTLLHAALLDLMITPEYPRAWRVIEHCLCDNHVVGSREENLYPVRYAAAWIAVRRFSHHPTELNLVPWSVINRAADHIDPQLAAPLLLALGAKLARCCDADSLEALRGTNTSDSRVALALSMIDDQGMARALAIKHDLLMASHPLFDDSDDLSTDDAQLSRWALSSSCRTWLSSMQGEADVESTLFVDDDPSNGAITHRGHLRAVVAPAEEGHAYYDVCRDVRGNGVTPGRGANGLVDCRAVSQHKDLLLSD
nr:HEAT repeat domain-containing protein [Pseudomonas petroselini]